MSSKLTKTEEMAAKLYFNDKLKPKEIAQKLGISVNTVYKAISKYRALVKTVDQESTVEKDDYSNDIPVERGDSFSTYSINLSVVMGQAVQPINNGPMYSYDPELLIELRELKKLVEELLIRVSKLEAMGCRAGVETNVGAKVVNETKAGDDTLPDFLRDNPWVDVLKSIHG